MLKKFKNSLNKIAISYYLINFTLCSTIFSERNPTTCLKLLLTFLFKNN